jgi:hypothetical protein
MDRPAACAASARPAPAAGEVQLAVLLAALQFVGEVFVIRHYSIALVWMTPVAPMMTEFVAPKPAGVLVLDRALETTLGASIAFIVILLTTRRLRHTAAGGQQNS